VPIRIDAAALAATADPAALPAMLRGLVRRPRRTAATASTASPAAFAAQLTELSDDERLAVLLDLVRSHAAAVLGHAGPDAVPPDRPFHELGFDSLSALELRNGLTAATGLRLSPMVTFDHKDAAELAEHLRVQLAAQGGLPVAQPQADVDAHPDTVAELFRAGVHSGNLESGLQLLRAVADIRPTFDSPDGLAQIPAPVRLADGSDTPPRLIFVNTPMATTGVHQHARLVAQLRTGRHVSAIPLPGFLPGESLPASAGAAIAVLTRSVLQAAGGQPFVLLGYSSGGLLAHAIAAELEATTTVRPAGLVLLDTYRVGEGEVGPLRELIVGLLEKESAFGGFHSARLSGMVRYGELLAGIPVPRIDTPVLFVQCLESFFPGSDPDSANSDSWRTTSWDAGHTVRTVAANHFDIVEAKAEITAQVIDEWLDAMEYPWTDRTD
jgi:thioesterase domain-containing protein